MHPLRLLPTLSILVAACSGGAELPVAPPEEEEPVPAWLEVGWISREPRLLPPDSLAAPDAGWPEPGTEVTWVAHLLNRGDRTASGVTYRWTVDGTPVETGTTDLPVGMSQIRWPRPWSFQRARIGFGLVGGAGDDTTLGDDTLTVLSDALSVGFWVHQRIYDALKSGAAPGFERQAQRWLVDWNRLLDRGTWPAAPDGVLDRLRLERVVVLPDSAGYPKDIDTDFIWYFGNNVGDSRFLKATSEATVREDQTIVLHELLHQRGVTDLYAYAVLHDTPNGSHVGITENGAPVAGTPAMPWNGQIVYNYELNGLMGDRIQLPGTWITEPTAYGLNVRAGLRTPRWTDPFGNSLNGFQEGRYQNLMPDTTRVRVRTPTGTPLAGARVEVFADHGDEFYKDVYRAEPDRVGETDADGRFPLPASILDGTPTVDLWAKPWTLIVRVTTDAGRDYLFLPGWRFNVLWFRGGVDVAEMDVTADPS